MLVFIDESGDPGFKIGEGSSAYFVISLVIFDDHLEAEKASVTIKELRRNLGLSDKYEFKFNTTKKEIIRNFIETVRKFKFCVRAMVVDKKGIYHKRLRSDKESFYNYFIMQLLDKSKGRLFDAKLFFDSRGERVVRNELRSYLSKRLNNSENHIFSKFKFVDSKQNTLVQLADIVSGSIMYRYTKSDTSFLQKLKRQGRIEDLWEFK